MVFAVGSQLVSVAFGVLFFWLVGISFFLYRSIAHYNRLVKGEDKKSLTRILDKILQELNLARSEIKNLQLKTSQMEKDSLFHIQKIGLLKFNPFKDIGGKQSFALSLLDEEDNGVVITALHGRETTRFYVKKIRKGKGVNYDLSNEEMEAIKKASKS